MNTYIAHLQADFNKRSLLLPILPLLYLTNKSYTRILTGLEIAGRG